MMILTIVFILLAVKIVLDMKSDAKFNEENEKYGIAVERR